jgi:hypothetical protein
VICSEMAGPASTVEEGRASRLRAISILHSSVKTKLGDKKKVELFRLHVETLRNNRNAGFKKGRELPSIPVTSWGRVAACTAVWGAYCAPMGPVRLHCCGLYGTEVFLIAKGEAGGNGEEAYGDGEGV